MAKGPSARELTELVEEVLLRLARDPEAAHLWHWQGRPRCDDMPAGPARRNQLKALLGLLGASALGGLAAGCKGLAGYESAAASEPGKRDGATTSHDAETVRDASPTTDATTQPLEAGRRDTLARDAGDAGGGHRDLEAADGYRADGARVDGPMPDAGAADARVADSSRDAAPQDMEPDAPMRDMLRPDRSGDAVTSVDASTSVDALTPVDDGSVVQHDVRINPREDLACGDDPKT